MAPRKTQFPKSRSQDERQIKREQHNFGWGMSLDVPASTIPNNGLREITDYINYGTWLTGRGGSRRWSATQPPVLNTYGAGTWTVSGTIRIVTAGTAGAYANLRQGQWIVVGGERERIVKMVSSSIAQTRTKETAASGSFTSLTSHGHYYGAIMHEGMSTGVIQFGDTMYTFTRDIPGYTPLLCVSTDKPREVRTFFQLYKNKVIAFNGGGIFLVNIDITPSYIWKLNTSCPVKKITDQLGAITYGYHYWYALSRLSGSGIRDRDTPGVVVEAESGPVKWAGSTPDYGAVWHPYPIDTAHGHPIGTMVNPAPAENPSAVERKWTHYTVYRTIDIGKGTTASPKQQGSPNLGYWVADVPMCRPMAVASSFDDVHHSSKLQILGGFTGSFTKADIGSTIRIHDVGAAGAVIGSYLISNSSLNLTLLQSGPSSYVYCDGSHTTPVGYTVGELGGCASVLLAQQTGTLVTATAGTPFTADDVGKRLVRDDGTEVTVTSFVDASHVNVDSAEVRTAVFAACFSPASRSFFDDVKDHILAPNIVTYDVAPGDANHSDWPLRSRLMTEIPAVDQGVVAPGWMVATANGGNTGYYGQVNDLIERHIGYYVADRQYFNIESEKIFRLRKLTHVVMVYCRNSSHALQLNSRQNETDALTGTTVSWLSQLLPVSQAIGLLDAESVVSDIEGNDICLCNDYSLRSCNGSTFGTNIFLDRLQVLIYAMHNKFTMHTDLINGIIAWGSQGDLSLPPSPGMAPIITIQPAFQLKSAGGIASLYVAAAGMPNMTYIWQKYVDGAWVAVHTQVGSGASVYNTPVLTAGDSGEIFRVTVSNLAGYARSNIAKITVVATPVILTQPTNANVHSGEVGVFTVLVAPGTVTPTYQWQKNTLPISGAIFDTFTTPPANVTGGDVYRCVITNEAGSVTSAGGMLVVAPALTFATASPNGVIEGTTATFLVVATGTDTSPNLLLYQWLRNNQIIVGATSSSYTTPATTLIEDGDTFVCTVTNSAGVAFSGDIELTVAAAEVNPTIITQPVSSSVVVETLASFSVSATGTHLVYQWYKNYSIMPGETLPYHLIMVTSAADNEDTFFCRVKNSNTSVEVESSHVVLTVTGRTFNDIDGNICHSALVGKQEWMKENLRVVQTSTGVPLPEVTDGATWISLPVAARCTYENSPGDEATYGFLYNYRAAATPNLAPAGWHVATSAEWATLAAVLGGASVASDALREAGAFHWLAPNTGATNSTRFTALPGGYRTSFGYFGGRTTVGAWWTSDPAAVPFAQAAVARSSVATLDLGLQERVSGYNIRCVKD